jgi:hypothetical protein
VWTGLCCVTTLGLFSVRPPDARTLWVVGGAGAIIKYTCGSVGTELPSAAEEHIVLYPNPAATE